MFLGYVIFYRVVKISYFYLNNLHVYYSVTKNLISRSKPSSGHKLIFFSTPKKARK